MKWKVIKHVPNHQADECCDVHSEETLLFFSMFFFDALDVEYQSIKG
jgi:hypothetical protein